MNGQFASVADLEERKASFIQLSEYCRGYAAEGDPDTGVIPCAGGDFPEARLILPLANHAGDLEGLREALQIACDEL